MMTELYIIFRCVLQFGAWRTSPRQSLCDARALCWQARACMAEVWSVSLELSRRGGGVWSNVLDDDSLLPQPPPTEGEPFQVYRVRTTLIGSWDNLSWLANISCQLRFPCPSIFLELGPCTYWVQKII